MRVVKALFIGAVMLIAPQLSGQTAFEAASVKQGSPFPGRPNFYIMQGGGLGTTDPGQFIATGVPLLYLVLRAYELNSFQVASSRSLETDRYDIVAKVPPGVTTAQVSVMLRNLLVERIGLVVHRETRQGPVYEMVVAKGGLKMKQAEPAPAGSATGDSPSAPGSGHPAGISMGKDDRFQLPPGRPICILYAIDASTMRITARVQGVPELIRIMERQAGRTVRDKTGLSGKYDFDFAFTREAGPAADWDVSRSVSAGTASEPGGDFFAAIQSQLGLRLVPKEGPVDLLIADKWNKVPAGN
jgi:uncharacterized protein (TIGR03435 family)